MSLKLNGTTIATTGDVKFGNNNVQRVFYKDETMTTPVEVWHKGMSITGSITHRISYGARSWDLSSSSCYTDYSSCFSMCYAGFQLTLTGSSNIDTSEIYIPNTVYAGPGTVGARDDHPDGFPTIDLLTGSNYQKGGSILYGGTEWRYWGPNAGSPCAAALSSYGVNGTKDSIYWVDHSQILKRFGISEIQNVSGPGTFTQFGESWIKIPLNETWSTRHYNDGYVTSYPGSGIPSYSERARVLRGSCMAYMGDTLDDDDDKIYESSLFSIPETVNESWARKYSFDTSTLRIPLVVKCATDGLYYYLTLVVSIPTSSKSLSFSRNQPESWGDWSSPFGTRTTTSAATITGDY